MVRLHIEFMPDGSVYFPRQGEVPPARYAYMFQCCGSNQVKIGSTRRAVTKRLAEIQRSCPEELQILCVFATSGHQRLEKQLKAHFAAYRIRGEWFALPDHVFAALRPEGTPATRPDAPPATLAPPPPQRPRPRTAAPVG